MTRASTSQNSFASGEIDPRLVGQVDIKAYSQGVKRARNVSRLATGGFERRYGTYNLAPTAAKAKLRRFEFSDTQRYMIAFTSGKAEIFSLDGELIQTVTACPWDDVTCFEMICSQQGDTMIISHVDFWPHELVRTAADTFALQLFVFDTEASGKKVCQPYYKFVAPSVTLSASAATGSVTITASSALFVAEHVGLRFRIMGCEVLVTAFTDSTHVTATVQEAIKVKLDADPFRTSSGSAVVEVLHAFHGFANGASVNFSGLNDVGGITAANLSGARTITVVDEHHYYFTAGAAATSSEDGGGSSVSINVSGAAVRDWTEQAFSAVRGYPGACGFHEGRLYFGGSTSQPDGRWGSKALAYHNFDVGTGADGDSVQGAIGSEDISRLRHIVSNSELQYFTATRELVEVTQQGAPITPTGQRIKSQSIAGCGPVQPIIFDGATLFVQENGRSVSEMTYSNEQGGYLAVPVSTLAGHLISNPNSAAASSGVVSRAEQFAYFANDDGSCAVFHSLRSENLAGWVLWRLGAGEIRSVEAVGSYVFFCVEVRGAYRLYRLATDDIVSLDGAVLHGSITAKTAWTIDARVRGREAHLVSELGYHGVVNVPANGEITLDVAVTNLVAGDAYYFEIETLPPEVSMPSGSRSRMKKRLVRTILELYDAHALVVDGQKQTTLSAGDSWEGAITPINGPREIRHLGFSPSPTVLITQDAPLPATILALTQEVQI